MLFTSGDRLGRYVVTALLGKGGMGEVYSARDTLLSRDVALKVLRASRDAAEGGTDGAARILREARAAAALTHTNAVAIYDVGEVDGIPYLAMELVSGRSIRTFIGDGDVSMERRIRWLVDTAGALGAAHALGIVHRDVKPENVMVRDDGIVKVLDFGIARRIATPVDPQAATELPSVVLAERSEGLRLGTPMYMAPEQIRGETLDPRADQFSWGVLGYELLTGTRPWTAGPPAQVAAQILSDEVPPPRERNPEVPAAVDAALRRALGKARESRFEGMDAVIEVLEPYAAVNGSPTERSKPKRVSVPPVVDAAAVTRPVSSRPDLASQPPQPPQRTPDPAAPTIESPVALAQPRAPSARARHVVLALVALVAGAGIVLVSRSSHRARTAALPDAAASPIESKMSENAEATAAYRAGMQALKDASWRTAYHELSHAVDLDPAFAAAHLRRALTSYDTIDVEMRKDLLAARNSRETLSEHDRLLLEALEPWTRVPPDLKESRARMESAAARFPESADFALELGWVSHHAGDSTRAIKAFDRALALDPTFALAQSMKARDLVNLDDLPGALAADDACLRLSPGATQCLEDLATLDGNEGKCDDMTKTVERSIAVAPDLARSYRSLAEGLFSTGEPIDAVRGALGEQWALWGPEATKRFQPDDEASLAILSGRFTDALRLQQDFVERIALESSETVHFAAEYPRMLTLLEIGRSGEALTMARDYLRRHAAWQKEELSINTTICIHAVELEAGGLTRARFDEIRDTTELDLHQRVQEMGVAARGYAGPDWAIDYALPASTAEEARNAVAHLPKERPLVSALDASPMTGEPIGRAYLLAGKLEEARATLTAASGSCHVLEPFAPLFSTWASYDLGQTLEALGDPAGACAAYARVLARWGAASPRSRTATKARARIQALHCPT